MTAPAPLTPADCDLRDFAFMPVDAVRLRDSDFAALSSAEGFRAGLLLWLASWHQVPAASLPDDDVTLARLAGFGRELDAWRAVKVEAIRGFFKCADGRLYHPVIAEKARAAHEAKKAQRERTEAARKARAARKAAETQELSQGLSQGLSQTMSQSLSQAPRERDRERDRETPLVEESARARDFDRKTWFNALTAAAGPGLADPAKAPSLHTSAAEFDAWAAAGVDLDLDAVPAITGATARARADPVASWAYFRKAVLKAHAQRTADLSDDLENAKADHARSDRPVDRRARSAAAIEGVLKARKLAGGPTPSE